MMMSHRHHLSITTLTALLALSGVASALRLRSEDTEAAPGADLDVEAQKIRHAERKRAAGAQGRNDPALLIGGDPTVWQNYAEAAIGSDVRSAEPEMESQEGWREVGIRLVPAFSSFLGKRRDADASGEAMGSSQCVKDLRLKKVFTIGVDGNDLLGKPGQESRAQVALDREAWMRAQLYRLPGSIPVSRFVPRKLSFNESRHLFGCGEGGKDCGRSPSNFCAAAGCLQSKIDLLRHIDTTEPVQGDGLYLLLEDDWAPFPDIEERMLHAFADPRAPCHFEFGRFEAEDPYKEPIQSEVQGYASGAIEGCHGTHAIFVTRHGAKDLADFYSNFSHGVNQEADCKLTQIMHHPTPLRQVVLNTRGKLGYWKGSGGSTIRDAKTKPRSEDTGEGFCRMEDEKRRVEPMSERPPYQPPLHRG